MVLDPGALLENQSPRSATLAPPGAETEPERAARVRRIAEMVKSGAYAVQTRQLAAALLEWDPRRSAPRGSAESADRRRTYMRDYMRRRRAGRLLDDAAPALRPQLPSSWVTPPVTSTS